MAEQVVPLARVIEQAVGGLTDDQSRVVEESLVQAVIVGARIGVAEAAAQAVEQGADLHLVLDIEPADPSQ